MFVVGANMHDVMVISVMGTEGPGGVYVNRRPIAILYA